jgi:hypothetical protein
MSPSPDMIVTEPRVESIQIPLEESLTTGPVG